MRVLRSSFGLVLALILSLSLVAAAEYSEITVQNGGRITGRVSFESDFPQAEKVKTNRDIDTCGIRVDSEQFVVDPGSKGLANVVLKIEGISVGKPFAKADGTISQIECRYAPHIVLLPKGQKLKIINKDPILHNIHAYKGKETLFNIAQPIQDQITPKTIKADGAIQLKCDVHSWMEAYVIVIENPYVAITDAQGGFTIPDVPPGKYSITMWHEALGSSSKEVTVTAGGAATVDFLIGG